MNDAWLGEGQVGRVIDADFIRELPAGVDSCGENGEFNTFFFEGPIFNKPIKFQLGEKVYKALELKPDPNHPPIPGPKTKGFWFVNLVLE